jgi:hypothetical protein
MQKNERFHAINKSFICEFYSRFIHRFHSGLKEQIDIGKSLGDLPDFVEDLWGFCRWRYGKPTTECGFEEVEK